MAKAPVALIGQTLHRALKTYGFAYKRKYANAEGGATIIYYLHKQAQLEVQLRIFPDRRVSVIMIFGTGYAPKTLISHGLQSKALRKLKRFLQKNFRDEE
ncbi:hypothetical protein HOO68_05945 [Candidatus Gracilibacteria bacterium]|nr:hypothetical protein [Candidatus Gracilibacteria bacterium]